MSDIEMASPIETLSLTAGYGLRQGPRLAWYVAHNYALGRARQIAERVSPSHETPRRPPSPTPDRNRLWRDLATLFARDLANVQAGIYPLPVGEDGTISDVLSRSRMFFEDLPKSYLRRRSKSHQEVNTPDRRGRFPRYYLQNFHYQSDGYLSEHSARLYDIQVEILFNGTANAMRRQVLVPVADFLKGRDQRDMRLLDAGCGTGRFLRFAKQAFPRLETLGVDLSEPYIEEARRHLGRRGRLRLAVANAEAIPVADESQDIVTTIYVFHELPPKIRRKVAGEFARILKPGGILVFADSLQRGDVADYDGLLDRFPIGYHEPYFDSYTREDLSALFAEAGFEPVSTDCAFLTKIAAFRRL